jgi:hypothetical protein
LTKKKPDYLGYGWGGSGTRDDGTHFRKTSGGGSAEFDRNNKPKHFVGSAGQEARFDSKGKIAELRDPKRHNMVIKPGLRPGDRRILTERNGMRLVSMGPHRGYLQRRYPGRDGRIYYQRTYWVGGHAYARIYRDHFYPGVHYYDYVPIHYYHPEFYRWAYYRWRVPAHYRWAWYGAPWYRYYGPYFVPAPEYPSAPLWLTDFLLAENLRLAYEAAQNQQQAMQAPPPYGGGPAAGQLTPAVKAAIEAEVERQLQAEQAEAQNGVPSSSSPAARNQTPLGASQETPPAPLDPHQHLFVVSSDLTVTTTEGQECELTGGDVIFRSDPKLDQDGKVRVTVMSSKQNDCPVDSDLKVEANDLQEMHNSFREQLDAGLDKLASDQGKGGLPVAPDSGTSPGVANPTPDQGVGRKLQEQQKQADDAEAEVQREVQTAQAPANQ